MKAAAVVGSAPAFLVAVGGTLGWLATGPYFHYSDTWQLVINTVTTVVTFLIVFLIQYSQNRDTAVLQLKLDELLRAIKPARTELVQMESLSDEELEKLRDEFREVHERAATRLKEIEASQQKRIRSKR